MTSNKDCRDYKAILLGPNLPSDDDDSDYDYFPSEESSEDEIFE